MNRLAKTALYLAILGAVVVVGAAVIDSLSQQVRRA